MLSKWFKLFLVFLAFTYIQGAYSDNQTPTTTPVLPQDTLPFRISIEQASFSLPNGLQTFIQATYKGQWLLLAGRTNGLHGFAPSGDFPPQAQNKVVYVVDPIHGTVAFKSLEDPSSGLDQHQIDILSVTAAQSFQNGNTLYITGGYGVDTLTDTFSTKDSLTAIDIPGLIHWVKDPFPEETARQHIRQTTHPLVQVTGGAMSQLSPHLPMLLIFGQNFMGQYNPNTNGEYTDQVRPFQILDDGKELQVLPFALSAPNPNYRRRDLNVVPIMKKTATSFEPALVALSGVFTLSGGIWTVPVMIDGQGKASMADPEDPSTFKQGMNNYNSPTITLFSSKSGDNYIVLLGGLSYGFFQDDVFETDPEVPFINQVTTIKLDRKGHFEQYLMEGEYPLILSTQSNPGNPLLFGAGARFFLSRDMPLYNNSVIHMEKLPMVDDVFEPVLLGYIVGGIQSTLPDTNFPSDSAASPYIFRVTLEPN